MIEFTTKSGATYLVDDDKHRYMRKGAVDGGDFFFEDYNDKWHHFIKRTVIEVDEFVEFLRPGIMFSTTTPVTSVREVPDVQEIDVD